MNHPQSFTKFYEVHKDSIYRLCTIMVYDKTHVDDLFQEVVISIWKGLKHFRNDSKIDTWVYRIVNNCSINYNLKQKRIKEKIENFEGFHEDKGKLQNTDMLCEKISLLKSADRMIIGLYLEGYSYKEIAEIMGLTTSNVGVRINRIKTELKLYFNQKN